MVSLVSLLLTLTLTLASAAPIGPYSACPVEVFPTTPVASTGWRTVCTTTTHDCFELCKAGDGVACYALGLALEDMGQREPLMYFRACRLGVAAGCTNAAAALDRTVPAEAACAARTFEQACAADDPWACTMFGTHLADGAGVDADPERALKYFAAACGPGESHPACDAARSSQRLVQEALSRRVQGPVDSRAIEAGP